MKGILKGLSTTFSTFTRKAVTVQYPEHRRKLPERQRSFPVLVWDFDHEEPFCTGCMVCVRNCPVDCMTAVMKDNPAYATGMSNRRKIIDKFWIDYGRCMRCNICVEVCNFEAIVMDNEWSGHEHAVFDRRDLHLDVDDLLAGSKAGLLADPFRPIDNISQNIAKAEGEEIPEYAMQGGRPAARQSQAERIAQGLPAGTKERDVEPAPEVAAAATGADGDEVDEEVAALPPRKLRARRMRIEKEAKALQAAGTDVTPELLNDLRRFGSDLYKEITGENPADPSAPAAAVATSAAPAVAAAAPAGNIGDPNSESKIRARRMRAEREAKPLVAAGEPVPADLLERLRSGQSPMYEEITGNDPGEAASAGAAPAAAAAAAAAPAGDAGDPNSERKTRARRMRAIRQAKELLSQGEPIPEDLAQTIVEAGGEVPAAGDS